MTEMLLLAATAESLQAKEGLQTAGKVILAQVDERRKINLKEQAYYTSLRTCRCGTVYQALRDHPGMGTNHAGRLQHSCRKCATRWLDKLAWEQPTRLFVGDLVLLHGQHGEVSDLWHVTTEYDGAPVKELLALAAGDPLSARIGVVVKCDYMEEYYQIVNPYVRGIKTSRFYAETWEDNQLTKVGRIRMTERTAVKELYDFSAFLYVDMMRQGRSEYRISPTPVRRQN